VVFKPSPVRNLSCGPQGKKYLSPIFVEKRKRIPRKAEDAARHTQKWHSHNSTSPKTPQTLHLLNPRANKRKNISQWNVWLHKEGLGSGMGTGRGASRAVWNKATSPPTPIRLLFKTRGGRPDPPPGLKKKPDADVEIHGQVFMQRYRPDVRIHGPQYYYSSSSSNLTRITKLKAAVVIMIGLMGVKFDNRIKLRLTVRISARVTVRVKG